MTEELVQSPWPGVILSAVLYTSDYVLTLVTARQYASHGKQKILIEGSFELNPIFQKHVDSGRWFSPRWLIAVLGLCLLVAALWAVTSAAAWYQGYLFVLGGMLFLQLAVHARHLRNLFLFTTALGDDGIRGRIEYPRWVVLSTSAFEFLTFGALYAIAYAVTSSPLLLGGTVCCLLIAGKHYWLRRRLGMSTGAAQQADADEAQGGTRTAG